MPDPRIPDDAANHAISRIGTWLGLLRPGQSADERQAATDAFFRSLGLEGEYDNRAVPLARTVLAHNSGQQPDDIEDDHVMVCVVGITLGLLLAEATGWEPPIPEAPEP